MKWQDFAPAYSSQDICLKIVLEILSNFKSCTGA